MYDYTYGTSTKKFKQEIEKMKPKLPLFVQAESKIISCVMRFLNGLDVNSCAFVCKIWYNAAWSAVLWQELCENIGQSGKIRALCELAESKLRTYDRRTKKNDLSELVPNVSTKEALKWKLIYGQLFYGTCSHCRIAENNLRFLPILQKTLCYTCAKLPNFTMISLENAEIEYGISRKQVNDYQIEGLRVPDPMETGKFIFVYYISDILRLKQLTEVKKRSDKIYNTEVYEKRRAELFSCMKKEGIDTNFINTCLESEGGLAYNYLLGKSKMPAAKIAKKVLVKYEKWKEAENENEDDDEALPEPEIILPLKRPKIELSAEELAKRKFELVERLLLMGVNSDDIGLDDKNSLAVAYIEGRTKEDLGPVAGSIWRDHRPVFKGVPFRTLNSKKESSSSSEDAQEIE